MVVSGTQAGLRHNEGMPRYASPSTPLPDAATKAAEMFGANPIRGAIIRILAQHPGGMTSGAIERELSASYQTVFRHLQMLVATGLVTTDSPEAHHGRRVIYTLDTEAVSTALSDYLAYLLAHD